MPIPINGAAPATPVIEVNALFGQFQVAGSEFVVKFASTFANADGIGHGELLQQLKPMRDRVDASELTDLTALLQRDLNDRRVAKELIPYLLGTGRDLTSRVGFFPAVLAVLIPKAYLRTGDLTQSPSYPIRSSDSDAGKETYASPAAGDFAWQTERYGSGGNPLPVGLLRLNPRECEVVVLDGQHRANAFRYIAGDFDPRRDIYAGFYAGIDRPEHFNADLPVTVIWFEAHGDSPVQPRLISRQLFVDVNNSAHSVSLSRTILLDDQSVSSLATQAFYNEAAQKGFRSAEFSLLHCAFDMDSDLASSALVLPSMALTTPEIVESAFRWLLLAPPNWMRAGTWTPERMRTPRNRSQFVQVVGTTEGILFGADDDEASIRVESPRVADSFRDSMRQIAAPVLLQLMNGITMLEAHYAAGKSVERWVQDEGDTTVKLAWEKIFTGGEGLYWTVGTKAGQDRPNKYALATASIEMRFRQGRADALGCSTAEADGAFKSFSTKAFQIGFTMAASFLAFRAIGGTDAASAAEELLRKLDRFTSAHWVALFREVRPVVFGGDANPRMWSAYRNLLLRMYDESGDANLLEMGDLPEMEALRLAVNRLADALTDSDQALPSATELTRLVTAERDKIGALFDHASLHSERFHADGSVNRGLAMLQTALAERS